MADLTGQTVAGYPIERLLEKGAYGELYQVATSAAPLAAKVLREDLRRDQKLCQAFAAGWEETRAVRHPSLVLRYSAGIDPALGAYSLEELIAGKTLRQFVQHGSKMAWRDALILAEQLFAALRALHQAQKCHGDLCPSNILITQDQDLKVQGAGALVRVPQWPADILTGPALGYLAPEVLQGSPLTPAADLYSAGACLYFALAGNDPFPGEAPQKTALERSPAPLSAMREELPPECEAFLGRLLAKNPAERYADAAAVLADAARLKAGKALNPLAGGAPAGAPRPRPGQAPGTPAPAQKETSPGSVSRAALEAAGGVKAGGSLAMQLKSTIPQSDLESQGDDSCRRGHLALALTRWREACEQTPHAALKLKIQLGERELKKEMFALALEEARQMTAAGQFEGAAQRANEAAETAGDDTQRREAKALAAEAKQAAFAAARQKTLRFAIAGIAFLLAAVILLIVLTRG